MINLDAIKAANSTLEEQFTGKIKVNSELTRAIVSFQANKNLPVYRWFKYKEAFSEPLVSYVLNQFNLSSGSILDPFAGSGTTLCVGSKKGFDVVGIELLPLGCEITKIHQDFLSGELEKVKESLKQWLKKEIWSRESNYVPFPHLNITKGAFPVETEIALCQYLAAVEKEKQTELRRLLRFAVLCILEEVSYTRKDGQYLRWDYRSNRSQKGTQFDKGVIKTFKTAISEKILEILDDILGNNEFLDLYPNQVKKGTINIINDSCLEVLPTLGSETFDCVITSPPYCNRYDYTRTYALELALLGITESRLKYLRQELMSCTVENKEKLELQSFFDIDIYSKAANAFNSQKTLQTILNYLEEQRKAKNLNNSGISRMVRNYFFEMSLVVFECARILKPGAPLVMVNDNVRYQGAEIPVDLILSDIAQKAGFDIDVIWVLPTGKGNSSQQMGVHGKEELRKSVYVWKRSTKQQAMKQDRQAAAVL